MRRCHPPPRTARLHRVDRLDRRPRVVHLLIGTVTGIGTEGGTGCEVILAAAGYGNTLALIFCVIAMRTNTT